MSKGRRRKSKVEHAEAKKGGRGSEAQGGGGGGKKKGKERKTRARRTTRTRGREGRGGEPGSRKSRGARFRMGGYVSPRPKEYIIAIRKDGGISRPGGGLPFRWGASARLRVTVRPQERGPKCMKFGRMMPGQGPHNLAGAHRTQSDLRHGRKCSGEIGASR